MRRFMFVIFAAACALPATEVTFPKVRMLVPDGKKGKPVERQVDLVFADRRDLVLRRNGAVLAQVPVAAIDKISYDYAKRHRVSEGAALAVLSLGAGAVTMLTKTTSHWLVVAYREANAPRMLTLRLDKNHYRDVISTAEAVTGKKIAMPVAGGGPERVTKGSKDVNQVVAFPMEKVEAAARKAMEANTCAVGKQEPGILECSRPLNGEIYKGEKVVVMFAPEGDGTRVRVETRKGVVGRALKKNWSRPVFEEMMRALNSAPV